MIFHHYDIPTNQRFNWRLLIGIISLVWVSFAQADLIPLTGVTQLWKGGLSFHSCVLTSGGGVKCWGVNSNGQFGDGSTTYSSIPVDVTGLTGVTAIATGYEHTCALTSSGGVKCSGYNASGQLGDDTGINRSTPVAVSGLTSGVTAIAAGTWHTCASISGGGVGVQCWGNNQSGQLGDNTTTNRYAPVDVSGLTGVTVTAIATGMFHTCALTNSGGVKCWGSNSNGQLGNNSSSSYYIPVDVTGLTDVTAIATGSDHTCALTSSGGVKCWGRNGSGQLGDGFTSDSWIPVVVSNLTSGVTAIAAGDYHTCALTSSGGVKCWGYNAFGQLGDNTIVNRSIPVNVSGLTGVTGIATGSDRTCALISNGGVKCWGDNSAGQLGDGSDVEHLTPVDVGVY